MPFPVALLAAFVMLVPSVDGRLLQGRLRVAGSETMVPLLTRWADAFSRRQPAVFMQVEGNGSESAVRALLSGTADLAAMSRPLSAPESDALHGRLGEFRIVQVGSDTLRLLASRGGEAWKDPRRAALAFRSSQSGIRSAGRLPGSGTRHEALSMLGLRVPRPGTIALHSPSSLQSALRHDPGLVSYGGSGYLLSDVVFLPGPSFPRTLILVVPRRNLSPSVVAFLDYLETSEGREIVRSCGFAKAQDPS